MVWWAICGCAVIAMLSFGLAAMLAAGTRADLAAMVVEARGIAAEALELAGAAQADAKAWRWKHEAMTYAFTTLCGLLKDGKVEVRS